MVLKNIYALLSGLSLSACSTGAEWDERYCHVQHQKEIALNTVPWLSPEQQNQEACSIFPKYLVLKKAQEQAACTLDRTIKDDEKQ